MNGLNPVWSGQTVEFDIVCPDLALIRLVVYDEDMFGDPNILGQATFPVKCLRSGRFTMIYCFMWFYIILYYPVFTAINRKQKQTKT